MCVCLFHSAVQVTSGMVLSTFLSAPIMYVSAWLLTIPGMDPKLLIESLQNVSFDISIVSLVALVSHVPRTMLLRLAVNSCCCELSLVSHGTVCVPDLCVYL